MRGERGEVGRTIEGGEMWCGEEGEMWCVEEGEVRELC